MWIGWIGLLGASASAETGPTKAPHEGRSAPAPEGTAGRGPVNRAMGTGEPRDPEPFTREQRFLYAVREGDRDVVLRALELGVSVHARDDLGRSALLLAVRDARSLELVKLLREHGARVDEPDASGRTPLSYAAGRGLADVTAYLISEGAEVDRADGIGRTPLYHAAIQDHAEIVALLHAHGAVLDARARHDETPLIAACAKGKAAAAARLLELGADPSLADKWGRTARDRAARAGPCTATPPGP